ncbi:hypothetical protein [Enterococcus hirae]|uniref:hypothetical protein n=1 Tax=Enterococcus hirae TaxID=1354 RepID=UPI00136A89C3|nr:hypothetical protein [Enterococcus hirae]NAE18266.1 hypothetical protein [Enterococcus hirae]
MTTTATTLPLDVAIAAALRTIAAQWPDLIQPVTAGGYSGVSGTSDARLPGGTERLSLAQAIAQKVAFWGWEVAHSHVCPRSTLDAHDTAGTAVWLVEHAKWIAGQDGGAVAAAELDDLARHLVGVMHPTGVRRPPVGACPSGECGGTVRARFGSEHEDGDLVCDLNSDHRWDVHSWRDLGRQLGHISDAVPERMRPEQLADYLTGRFGRQYTASTVRNWPARYPWFPRPDKDGTYDRIRVVAWVIERRAAA